MKKLVLRVSFWAFILLSAMICWTLNYNKVNDYLIIVYVLVSIVVGFVFFHYVEEPADEG